MREWCCVLFHWYEKVYIYIYIYIFNLLFLSLFFFLFLSIILFIDLSIHLSISLTIYWSIFLSIYHIIVFFHFLLFSSHSRFVGSKWHTEAVSVGRITPKYCNPFDVGVCPKRSKYTATVREWWLWIWTSAVRTHTQKRKIPKITSLTPILTKTITWRHLLILGFLLDYLGKSSNKKSEWRKK